MCRKMKGTGLLSLGFKNKKEEQLLPNSYIAIYNYSQTRQLEIIAGSYRHIDLTCFKSNEWHWGRIWMTMQMLLKEFKYQMRWGEKSYATSHSGSLSIQILWFCNLFLLQFSVKQIHYIPLKCGNAIHGPCLHFLLA